MAGLLTYSRDWTPSQPPLTPPKEGNKSQWQKCCSIRFPLSPSPRFSLSSRRGLGWGGWGEVWVYSSGYCFGFSPNSLLSKLLKEYLDTKIGCKVRKKDWTSHALHKNIAKQQLFLSIIFTSQYFTNDLFLIFLWFFIWIKQRRKLETKFWCLSSINVKN